MTKLSATSATTRAFPFVAAPNTTNGVQIPIARGNASVKYHENGYVPHS